MNGGLTQRREDGKERRTEFLKLEIHSEIAAQTIDAWIAAPFFDVSVGNVNVAGGGDDRDAIFDQKLSAEAGLRREIEVRSLGAGRAAVEVRQSATEFDEHG